MIWKADRTILTLSFEKKQAEKTSRNRQLLKTMENKRLIIEFLLDNGSSKAIDIGAYLGLSSARTRVLLSELAKEGKVQTEGNGRLRKYGLLE